MRSELEALLERLTAAQAELFQTAARSSAPPSDRTLSKIADLELSIAAGENALDKK